MGVPNVGISGIDGKGKGVADLRIGGVELPSIAVVGALVDALVTDAGVERIGLGRMVVDIGGADFLG